MWEIIVLTVYFVSVFFIIVFSIGQLALVILYFRIHKKRKLPLPDIPLRSVTVQLPIYNEQFVVQRLLHAVSRLDYPKELLEIQILDDSTDETKDICGNLTDKLSLLGFKIEHIHRDQRKGFKAGALQEGLSKAKGEFIAIFDADFIPRPDFLKKTLPYFNSKKTGMVQTRWGHINELQSWLTRAQALGLNGHFIIDQASREQSGLFMNFNGTAGIWRKRCIEDAGGWHSDTLTEDLDLSYRAQMRGWNFRYCQEIVTPAELPSLLNALRSQQFRWIKGGVETSRKIFTNLWRCNSSFKVKIFGSFHLLSNYIYLFIFLNALLSVPVLFIKNLTPALEMYFSITPYFFLVFMINSLYCFMTIQAVKRNMKDSALEFAVVFPVAIFISLGMSFRNTMAIVQGLTGKKTSFIRTPKFMGSELTAKAQRSNYITNDDHFREFPEILLFTYFLFAAGAGVYFRDIGFLMYHLMLLCGFGLILYYASKEIRIQNQAETKTAIDLNLSLSKYK